MEFAKKVRSKRFSRVEISYRGVTKFSVDGASFQRVGNEYAKHNYDFVLYKFPKLLHRVGPQQPDSSGTDADALLRFHKQWYGQDPMTRPVANGL